MLIAEHCSPIIAGPGGVMTDDVGVVTGELELRTACDERGALAVAVRYAGADEWYTVTGATVTVHDPADSQAVHDILVAVLHRPEG